MLKHNEKIQTKNRQTNSRIKAYNSYAEIKKALTDTPTGIPSAAVGTVKVISNYSSMRNTIQRIADPVPFEFLKTFYGLN